MTEIIDKFLIKIIFAIIICAILFVYKYLYSWTNPNARQEIGAKFNPSLNAAQTLHFFGRIIGICIIYSTLGFNELTGLFFSSFHFIVWNIIAAIIYLISIYILESIILYNFDFIDEVIKRKNMSYSIISFCICLNLAFVIKLVITEAEGSLVFLLMMWLFSLVVYGLSTKLFKYVSIITFYKMMIQKSIGLAISYSGFLFGNLILLYACFNEDHRDIKNYAIKVMLKLLLCIIIFPIFNKAMHLVFLLNESDRKLVISQETDDQAITGYGVYEGLIYLSSALLTSVIVGKVLFGTIYPFS